MPSSIMNQDVGILNDAKQKYESLFQVALQYSWILKPF